MKFIDVKDSAEVKRYNKIVKSKPIIVLFYAEWCGHCKNLAPEWEEFEKYIMNKNGNNIEVSKVNSDYINSVDGHRSIMGYPTISHLYKGEHKKDFEGPRTKDGLIEFYNELNELYKDEGDKSRSKTRSKTRSMKGGYIYKKKRTKRRRK